MNIAIKIFGIGAATFASSAIAAADTHAEYLRLVAAYRPMAAFNHVVGDMRFVGYFLSGPDRCDVTVFQAHADDEALTTPPRRYELQIAAGGRSEIEAGPGSAIAIACTADADAIKIAPQFKHDLARATER